MNPRSNNYTVEMKFSGHTKIVEFSFFEYVSGLECRCRVIWSDNFTEFWMHVRAEQWKFKNRKTIPVELVQEELAFHRIIKILQKK